MIRVIINGGFGAMGTMTYTGLQDCKDIKCIARLGRDDDLAQCIDRFKPDMVVELTQADCVMTNSRTIIRSNTRPLIGASGLNKEQIEDLKAMAQSQSIGGLIVPNFSVSALLMMQFSQIAAQYMHDVDIVERHHPGKLDAPSGTARATAERIAQVLEKVKGHHQEIPIHSQRIQGALAHQTVRLGMPFEQLVIHQDSFDRRCFLPGIVMAIRQVMTLDMLQVGLELT